MKWDIPNEELDCDPEYMNHLDHIDPINMVAKERLGYPTQKPEALLERIVEASSNKGDVVLDPFCGCGTTIHSAEKLKRQWVGIDIIHLAISLIEKRLGDAFPGIESKVGVCGGDPCIVRTRIPVWILEQARRLGASEADLLRSYPTLRAEDLVNAWGYVRAHRDEIERQICENEAA